ncbi:MAG: S1 family peptidase [Candidatus Woesearchaeota archaeon]
MSKLVSIIRTTGILSATGISAYVGIQLGDQFSEHLPNIYKIPEIVQGYTAFVLGNIGNGVARKVLGKKRISPQEAYSIAALNAFVNASNEARNLSSSQSLEQISDNLVEVIVENDKEKSVGSGLMITTDGYVITAHHVVENMIANGAKAKIRAQNGLMYSVPKNTIWYNQDTDIAIIKATKVCPYSKPIKVKVDQSCNLNKGKEVRILGFRDGQKYNTMGVITNPSHIWRQPNGNSIHDLFQTDARAKEGQSGGIIANGNGEIIGIVVYTTRKKEEEIGLVGGARISNALTYINQIAAIKSAKMFR